ncbi:MAG: UbiD family decarboxylase [bacterium]|jgi:UbiD family decarboxylase
MAAENALRSTRDFLNRLYQAGELLVIEDEVDPNLELAQIQKEVVQRKGPALLFKKVKGTPFPMATNLYGSTRRLEIAFGDRPFKFIKESVELLTNLFPPSFDKVWGGKNLALQAMKIGLDRRKNGAVWNNSISPVNLQTLPQLKSWPEDGGGFITYPLVYTESPSTGKGNLGMYRVQMHDETHAGMHIQIHRGGGFHYHEAELKNEALPASVFVGGPPALTIAAIAPLPEDIPELIFASLLMGKRLAVGKPEDALTQVVLDADFCIQGLIPPHKRMPEGPFGDHYGYYSLQHDYPYMDVQSIHYRDNAVFPATVVGRPPQEDHYIAEFLQDILEPLITMVMPNVKKLWAYEESGVHSLAAAIVKERYRKEAFTTAMRILGEGQLSLTKFLIVTDQDCNLKDFRSFFELVLERADFKTDLFILSNISQDTLDYTGPEVNKGSKAILLGLGKEKKKNLVEHWGGSFKDSGFSYAKMFCKGVLCVKGDPYALKKDLAQELVKEPDIQNFSVVCLVDDPNEAVKSGEDFIWHIFTRFEPAADIYGNTQVERFHIGIEGPVIIDCRMKPWYPKALEDDPKVAKQVEEKWKHLFNQM